MSTQSKREATPFHQENLERVLSELHADLEAREFEVMNMERFDHDKLSELHDKQTKQSQMLTWIINLGNKHFPNAGPRIHTPGKNGMHIIGGGN